jgi:hypothetical protein
MTARRHRLAFGALALLAALLAGPAAARAEQPETQGIVSLRVTAQAFDPVTPWIKTAEQGIQGNALVVEGNRLLTTADMVKNATLIEVRKFGRYPDYSARAVLVDYETNLALLEVPAPEFWQNLAPLPLAQQPARTGQFAINRWRSNGRFEQGSGELVDYSVITSRFGSTELPVLRGTTSMSGLGWSEFITAGGRVTAMLTSHDNQQIEAIPASVLALFIRASRQQPGAGFAQRGFTWQALNHAGLRKFHGLPDDSPGVLVRTVRAGGTGAHLLRPGDILAKIGPYTVDSEGQIEHPLFGMMLFTIALNESLDDTIPAEVLRDGKPKAIKLRRLRFTPADYRVAPQFFDRQSDYEVQGGLVMQELSLSYLRAWGKGWNERGPARLVTEAVLNSLREANKPPEKVVFISKVMPDPFNLGYDDLQNVIVVRANGRAVQSLADFREALRSPVAGFHTVEMLPGQSRAKLVFKADSLEAANRRIRERYSIPAARHAAANPATARK